MSFLGSYMTAASDWKENKDREREERNGGTLQISRQTHPRWWVSAKSITQNETTIASTFRSSPYEKAPDTAVTS